MSYLDWHVGMKVVCVDDEWPEDPIKGACPLHSGQVYEIAEIGVFPGGKFKGVTGVIVIRIVGLKNIHTITGVDLGFSVSRFRPIQTRKSDISIFQSILLNPHIKISEDA